MHDIDLFDELQIRNDLAKLLLSAIETSGKKRLRIAKDAKIHKDTLRRILCGERSASISEILCILRASGAAPRASLYLYLAGGSDQAISWLHSDAALFLDAFLTELPNALERILRDKIDDVKPRWGKGAASRLAQIIFDHIEEINAKDALFC